MSIYAEFETFEIQVSERLWNMANQEELLDHVPMWWNRFAGIEHKQDFLREILPEFRTLVQLVQEEFPCLHWISPKAAHFVYSKRYAKGTFELLPLMLRMYILLGHDRSKGMFTLAKIREREQDARRMLLH